MLGEAHVSTISAPLPAVHAGLWQCWLQINVYSQTHTHSNSRNYPLRSASKSTESSSSAEGGQSWSLSTVSHRRGHVRVRSRGGMSTRKISQQLCYVRIEVSTTKLFHCSTDHTPSISVSTCTTSHYSSAKHPSQPVKTLVAYTWSSFAMG